MIGTATINALNPKTNPRFAILLPIAFPIATSERPFNEALALTNSSGAEVPNETIVTPIIIGGILIFSPLFVSNNYLSITFFTLGLLLIMFTFWFFRDPDRKVPEEAKTDTSLVLSPADGKVVEIVEEDENYYLKDKVRRISIFLSPLNVHVNRIPLSGVVKYLKYIKGEYLVAFNHKASEKNERSEIGIENEKTKHKILFKQIAGFVARRIVYDICEGNNVTAGEKFGMIKFGSRVDILIKRDSRIFVTMEQKVTGGETIIAEL